MVAYSAFFSSGLLAPRSSIDTPSNATSKGASNNEVPRSHRDCSPIRPASPLSYTDSDNDAKSDIESDVDMGDDNEFAREATPTQHSVSAALSHNNQKASKLATSGPQSRLRRRRSSLTMGTSPIAGIRSSTRNVGTALQLQRHLITHTRNVSLNAPPSAPLDGGFPPSLTAAGETLMSRPRSGSMGSSAQQRPPPSSAVAWSSRRHVRRTTSVPAPAPPPSTPLPDVPSFPSDGGSPSPVSRTPFACQNHDMPGGAGAPASTKASVRGRDRGLSVASSVGRIDEEVKEN